METKPCSICGKVFTQKNSRQLTCSTNCSKAHNRKLRTIWQLEKYHKDNPIIAIDCPGCGCEFFPTSHKQDYCSPACWERHYWNTPEGRLKKAEKDKRYLEKNRDSIRERSKEASKKYYHKTARGLGIPTADICNRRPDGTFPMVNGAANYRRVQRDSVGMSEHRLIWENVNGPIPEGYVIHHINTNKKDNRIENLQIMTASDHTQFHMLARSAEQKKLKEEGIKDDR